MFSDQSERDPCSSGASAISEGDLFTYSCSAQLISFEVDSISKEINCAEHEYMNMSPSLIALAPLLDPCVSQKYVPMSERVSGQGTPTLTHCNSPEGDSAAKGFAIVPYIQGIAEPIRRVLNNCGIKLGCSKTLSLYTLYHAVIARKYIWVKQNASFAHV